jgi:uncharacterized membrane protein
MRTYNEIAARNVDRVAALSDGVFAVALTVIVLQFRVPDLSAVHSDADLVNALLALAPQAATYLLSFMTLGLMWNGQQTQLNYIAETNRHLTWLHLAFLAMVAVLPFTTSLLATFITYRVALFLYWANLLLLGVTLYAGWVYTWRSGLQRRDIPIEVRGAINRRIFAAQGLYAIGFALCLISTEVSIAFIILVQLNFAISPRLPVLSRL